MAILTFPLWIIFAVLSPILMIFFILGFTSAQTAISEKPPVVERHLS